MWNGIWGFLAALPKILDLLINLFNTLSEVFKNWFTSKKIQDMNSAIEKAKLEKDTKDLEDMFNGGSKK